VRPSGDRLSDSSDLDEKLVTSRFPGTATVPSGRPAGVSCSRKIREVTPKFGSARTLLKTCGCALPAVAVTQPVVHPGGSWVFPATMPGLPA
jgi:hypothetical protein